MTPAPLPIDPLLPEIAAALRRGNLVLHAPTGAGKTTRVPGALLDGGASGRIVMLEPRRLAARASAARIARERGVELGRDVGYAVRFDARYGAATRILVVTDGLFLRMLQDDPFLDGVSAVLFDEFHERSLNLDLALALTRGVQRDARPDLRLLAMSATLDPGPVAEFLGDAPVLGSDGRSFAVAVEYAGDGSALDWRSLPSAVRSAVVDAAARTAGDVLVFLPGVGEIRRVGAVLDDWATRTGFELVELYGELPAERQDAALQPGARRKIVLATNVAETSVTVPGVTAVVDSGLARILEFDASVGLDRLVLQRISRASAEQRSGRAGRTAPGLCLRLWSEREHRHFAARTEPEIRRVDLAGPVLQLHAWGEADVRRFGWFEAPKESAIERAAELLASLGAVDAAGKITPRGRRLAGLPAHPRLGRLLDAASEFGCLREGAAAAALLAERDPFVRETRPLHSTPGDSDVVERLRALERFRRTGATDHPVGVLQESAARRVLTVAEQFSQEAERICGRGARAGDPERALGRALLAAYPDRVCRRRTTGQPRGVMVGGRGVALEPSSVVADAELFLAVEVVAAGASQAEDRVALASAVDRAWLGAAQLSTAEVVEFDEATKRAVASRRLYYCDLVIEETPISHVSDAALSEALVRAAKADPRRAMGLERPEVAQFLARLAWLRGWMPELELPVIDERAFDEILPALCAGKRSLEQLRTAPVLDYLRARLTHSQLTTLEREAPSRFTVPSGSQIALQYEPDRPPVLAVRIQEVFGLADTPRLAAGRAPVQMHLLAPNFRPQQVTQDLRSFWNGAYRQVRKELRARYPKHAWPEDPWTALPQRGAKRRN